MITRGIIEKSIDQYHVKVRIPSVDRVDTSSVHTSTDNLNTAVFATLPGCEVRLQPGDVVIVSIEDFDEGATILGYLYRNESIQKQIVQNLSSLTVGESAKLPISTTIGKVSSSELAHLSGVNENLQKQLNDIKERLALLEEH